MSRQPTSEQQATVKALLGASQRCGSSVPIRRTFVQQGEQRSPQPGPLHPLLRAHDERALDLFLLHRAAASSEPWDVTRDARMWARTLGLTIPGGDNGASAVSKIWARLEKYGLVRRERRSRLARVVALREDGGRSEYTYPIGGRDDPYFKLPYHYWLSDQAHYVSLSFPAKAVLLIALSLRPPFILPVEKAPKWYGISADSAERGLRELRQADLLTRKATWQEDWLSGPGKVLEYRYRLWPPYARSARTARGHLAVVTEAS